MRLNQMLALAVVAFLVPVAAATAASYEVIYRFKGGSDGQWPVGGVTIGADGALYGLAEDYCGQVYRLTPPKDGSGKWRKQTLWSFTPDVGGCYPGAGKLVVVGRGDSLAIYGAVSEKGRKGGGSVFRLTPDSSSPTGYRLALLHEFSGTKGPNNSLVRSANGDLYGTTQYPASIFRLSPEPEPATWSRTVLYRFPSAQSAWARTGLTVDNIGVLYGTTFQGGKFGLGSLYRLLPPAASETKWNFETLYNFSEQSEGNSPNSTVTLGPDGSLFSTTDRGSPASGLGTTFRIFFNGSTWKKEMLRAFGQGEDGSPNFDSSPYLIGNGSLLGSAVRTLYRLDPPSRAGRPWKFRVIHRFGRGSDGDYAIGTLVRGADGAFYGVTQGGGGTEPDGTGWGTVYRYVP